ncbi:hypothetical protein ACFFS2_39805 [Streptomyces aurantiacus]|uniref:Uncharacterized protein n=1 Tax=Streptomyces aurantiacus TaxID=47760 RepID=A0A7G1NU18_9ACTN|nr:hypothetical protein [Streptomyces aurantiacus]BCL25180.1 hypothetical protein GCM10017557_00390 [Streptomyces aurantiacus]
MSRTPRSIDGVLRRARVFQGDYTVTDLEEARHRLARHLHDLRWVQHLTTPDPLPVSRRSHSRPAALHERADGDLRLLSRGTIRHHGAALCITAFDTTRDPDGALPFACLLYLADQTEGARFWWHYAAGSGNVTAALCLHLLHLHHGEHRDAEHWATQIHDLNALAWGSYTPVPHHAAPADTPTGPSVRYTLPGPVRPLSKHALKNAIAVLHTAHDQDLGPVPQPPSVLADHWQELVTT